MTPQEIEQEKIDMLNSKPMTPEQLNEQEKVNLREMYHWYGGWDELRKVIAELEDNDNEAAFDRSMEDYGPNAAELADRQYQNQKLK